MSPIEPHDVPPGAPGSAVPPPPPQDPDRVPGRLVRVSALTVALAIAGSVGAALLLARGQLAEATGGPAEPPPPRLDVEVFREETRAEHERRRADAHLARYGWTDRERGRIHVPLDVAIELYLREAPR